jgi:hypothetical protein
MLSGFDLRKLGIRFVEKHGTRLYTHCWWGSCKGNFMACKGIFLLCVNNALSEKNTSFRRVYFVCSTEPLVRKFSIVAYIVSPHGVVEGVLFLQNISTATFSWPMLCKKYSK